MDHIEHQKKLNCLFCDPAPIKELEYDDRFDCGADVSVMESLGGPSLLIEKQRPAEGKRERNEILPRCLSMFPQLMSTQQIPISTKHLST
jgi:hypothetical protein